MPATTDIKEKREIISALAEIAVKLDGYDTDLKNLKKRAEFSTVYLRVYEKNTYAPPSYWDELGESCSEALRLPVLSSVFCLK